MPIMVLVWCRPGASVGTQITVTARPRQRRRPSCKKLAASPQLLGQHDRGQPHHGRRPGRMVPDQPVHQRGEQERRDAGPGPTHRDQPGHRPNQQQDRRLRAQAPQRRPGRGHAAQEKGAEGRSCRVVERQPEGVDACGGGPGDRQGRVGRMDHADQLLHRTLRGWGAQSPPPRSRPPRRSAHDGAGHPRPSRSGPAGRRASR